MLFFPFSDDIPEKFIRSKQNVYLVSNWLIILIVFLSLVRTIWMQNDLCTLCKRFFKRFSWWKGQTKEKKWKYKKEKTSVFPYQWFLCVPFSSLSLSLCISSILQSRGENQQQIISVSFRLQENEVKKENLCKCLYLGQHCCDVN